MCFCERPHIISVSAWSSYCLIIWICTKIWFPSNIFVVDNVLQGKLNRFSFCSIVKICSVERTEIWNFLFLTLCAWFAKLLWDYRAYADSHTLSQCDILLLVFFEHCFGPQLFYKLMLTIYVEWSSHIISYCIPFHIFRLCRKI